MTLGKDDVDRVRVVLELGVEVFIMISDRNCQLMPHYRLSNPYYNLGRISALFSSD